MSFWMKAGANAADYGKKARHRRRFDVPVHTAQFLSEAQFREKANGFVAIYEKANGQTRLYLRQHAALRDESGRVYHDAALNWKDYGRTWRAYIAQPPAPCPSGARRAFLKCEGGIE